MSSENGDLLKHIEVSIPNLSKSEVKIARLLLEAPQEFVRSSVRAIANKVDVSEPTIVRFCRNVGCEGFKDLKFRLTEELAFSQALQDARGHLTPSESESVVEVDGDEKVGNRIFRSALESLTSALNSFETAAIHAAAKAIATANRVMVYGIGGSSAILALEMHNRLFRLGIATMVFTDNYVQRMSSATLTNKDVAIFVSSTGRPRMLQDCVELAKYYRATCIAITDSESILGREADICLNVPLSQSGVAEFQPNPMRFAQLFVIDCLAYVVAAELGDAAHATLRKTRASVASLHGLVPQQPIGD